MHILIVNDDGPPSAVSPYIASFVRTLRGAGHLASVVIPSTNNSGAAKAYNFGKILQPYRYYPPSVDGEESPESWILVDGTPASCVQLGIYHLLLDLPPIDLVISGPNYGHNLTSVYNLASGTLGGALEGALYGKKAVSLSFAFGNHLVPGDDGIHSTDLINAACKVAARLIERLYENWHQDVEVYHINVPLLSAPWRAPRVVWTTAVRSSMSSPSIFRPAGDVCPVPTGLSQQDILQAVRWAPQFTDVKRSIDDSPPGTDAWALKQGFIGFDNVRNQNASVLPRGTGSIRGARFRSLRPMDVVNAAAYTALLAL